MFDPDDGMPVCEHCGYELDSDDCWNCHGEGYFDLYEDSPLEYAPGETETCQECEGTGVNWWCSNKKCPAKVP